ncbi:energy transducer TonB [Methylovirgula ligni]|nr:TonB family protein [Methylovirgula ligni]QAY95816.1 energy transducer TonB [Methylovirgula ligni]
MMTAVSAPRDFAFADEEEAPASSVTGGAHSLLEHYHVRPAYVAQGVALVAYALALVGLCYLAKPKPIPQDDPIELTMVADDNPAPLDTPDTTPTPPDVAEQTPDTPPVTDPTPPEQTALATPDTPPPDQDVPPPALDQQETVAPVPPPPPVAVQHRPKPRTVAAHTASPRHVAAASGASRASNALPSYYANEVHARIARVASETAPDGFTGSGRVPYRIVISPSGDLISKSITPSGNAAFDRAAAEALERAAPFPATGTARPVSLYGAIAYRN